MPELFETRRVRDDPAHWDALAARVAVEAIRSSRAGGFDWFARSRAGWITVILLLAAALTFLMLPARGSVTQDPVAEWGQALAPADAVGKAITLLDRPPLIGSLLLGTREELR